MSSGSESELLTTLADCYEELKAFLLRKFGSPQLEEEVVQENWMRVHRLSPTPQVNQPRVYLFKMASNLAIDNLRAEKARTRYIATGTAIPEDVRCHAPLPDRVLDYQQRLVILRQAVDELPPRCREVFLLHKLEGVSHAEIASLLGISKNMVEKHVIRGLAHCRDRLRKAVQ
ncbi:MAG: sigma-70 family RNA polymerase sigma factor [Pseudomonadota bacterium]|nr:sigma-70 family RNA polymerase sigma factor [Pseudomonadota bacterium]